VNEAVAAADDDDDDDDDYGYDWRAGERRAGRLTARTWSSSPDSDHILPGPLITGEVALFARRRSSRAAFVDAAAAEERAAGAPSCRSNSTAAARGGGGGGGGVFYTQVRRSTFVVDRRQPHA